MSKRRSVFGGEKWCGILKGALLLFLSFFFETSTAQRWLPIGPFSKPEVADKSDFSSIAANGVGRVGVVRFAGEGVWRRLLVCTPYDGIRISKTDPIGWYRPSMKGMPATGISDIHSFDRKGEKLLAATGDADCGLDPDYPAMNSESCQSRGLFLSADAGESWTGPIGNWYRTDGSIDSGFWNYPSLKIARRLLLPRGARGAWFVVIHTRNAIDRKYNSWVYRSLNQGKDWYPVLQSDDGWFKGITAHPERPTEIYITGRSVYLSCDGGETWTDIGKKGLPADSLVERCEVSFGPLPDRLLYVMVNNRSSKANELYVIARRQTSFSKLSSGVASPPWRTAFSADQSNTGRLLFSAGNKVNRFESVSGAWRAVATAAGPHDDVHEITTDPSDATMYVSHDGGLHMTADAGRSWTDLSAGLDVSEPWGVSIASDSSHLKVLCGTQDCGTVLYTASVDRFIGSWQIVRGGDGMKPLISRNDPDSMIAVDGNNNLNHYTVDGGIKWSLSRPVTGSRAEYLRPLVADPLHPETLYTGYLDLYRSFNYGKDWVSLKVPGKGTITSIAIAPSDPDCIYVAYAGPSWSENVSGKLFRTTDGGLSWTDVSQGLRGAAWTSVSSIAINPTDASDVMVGFRGGWTVKAMRSSKGLPQVWIDVSEGLPADADVNALLYDTRIERNSVYAATHQGVYRFNPVDGSWSDFNGGMPPVLTVDLDMDASGTWLCAATHGRGVWLTRMP